MVIGRNLSGLCVHGVSEGERPSGEIRERSQGQITVDFTGKQQKCF